MLVLYLKDKYAIPFTAAPSCFYPTRAGLRRVRFVCFETSVLAGITISVEPHCVSAKA